MMTQQGKVSAATASSQAACSTCSLGCPTALGVQNLPPNVQKKVDGLVSLMRSFAELCLRQEVRCGSRGVDNLTDEVHSSFLNIVRTYKSLLSSEGQIYPALKSDLDGLVGLHANDVFRQMVSLSRK